MSDVDPSERIRRLSARVERERAARREAEAIAERVTTERWNQSIVLEDKLAARTEELEAARRSASAASAERDTALSELSHRLRTSLTALFYEVGSLNPDQPPGEQRLARLTEALEGVREALDEQSTDDAGRDGAGRQQPEGHSEDVQTVSSVLDDHEEGWQRAAARSGKLLMIDLGPGTENLGTLDPASVNELVLEAIERQADSPEPIVELRLATDPSGDLRVQVGQA